MLTHYVRLEVPMESVISRRWQITIPKPIRDRLQPKPGDGINLFIEEGVVYLCPVRTVRPQ
jgi:AbrB family looped-hinge helix DNA binding protein